MKMSRPDAARSPAPDGAAGAEPAEPLSEADAEEHIHGICFKTGPPRKVGVELEWLVRDGRDPGEAAHGYGCVAKGVLAAVSQLAESVIAPGLYCAIGQKGQAERASRSYCGDSGQT